MTPQRIQLRRTKGWRLPEGAVVVSRPSKWGNPWRIVPVPYSATADLIHAVSGNSAGRVRLETAAYWAVQNYRLHLVEHPKFIVAARDELAGHDLACWCPPDQPCHADVLLQIANPPP